MEKIINFISAHEVPFLCMLNVIIGLNINVNLIRTVLIMQLIITIIGCVPKKYLKESTKEMFRSVIPFAFGISILITFGVSFLTMINSIIWITSSLANGASYIVLRKQGV